ncbi:MAG: hypothetical protein A2Z83_03735 [Omnitrophica bacterium GWA2_52_8]|nr:MAG: hypothetical protein A2Z83_03735 [Omnitrophica bacterium GWA2_52_8]
MKRFSVILVLVFLFSAFRPACADAVPFENFQASSWVKEKTYVDQVTGKLGFGILNVFTGWSALFFEPYKNPNKFSGLAKGIWRTVTNSAGGALHAVTFIAPFDIPLPDGGVRFDS